MDPFDHNSITTFFAIKSGRRDYFDQMDEITDVIYELFSKCQDLKSEALVWKHVIEKCLEHEMPEHYRVAFEKLTESYSTQL